MKKTSTQKSGISNPSFGKNPTLWNAVALQQEFAKEFKVERKKIPAHPVPARNKSPSKRPAAGAGSSSAAHDHEHVHPKLTLAQKLGLADAPPEPLTEEEWTKVQKMAKERQDSEMPCPICQEEFRTEPQVILSCSHVFHKTCLVSFEKFAHTKTCPMCRREQYQKRLWDEGSKVWLERCATKIQSVYRGHVARKRVFKMMLDRNPDMKRAHYANEFSKITNKFLDRFEQEQDYLDKFLEQIDQSVAKARLNFMTPDDWEMARAKALERSLGDCSICMCSMEEDREREVSLLNCSHCFHTACIRGFENFSTETIHVCPVCRATYQRIPL